MRFVKQNRRVKNEQVYPYPFLQASLSLCDFHFPLKKKRKWFGWLKEIRLQK
jgi:hypothetical protein